ncbi:MAG: sigma-54-dependent Fis family transcriptional regulator [Bacteroidales bacterium]|nr:sigma-54-dependent Fis family transcriptional regulator [Bacteroidales bacterium]
MGEYDIQVIKQRYNIIGSSLKLNRAIEIALQVAATDLTVLILGESGAGKENFPKIIHANSARKHNNYIAVNCGAIPEGTIDSELFGHEKGSFTGATEARKGYFEQSDGGTIFLDEVAELPMGTQARLLRVLESGEFIKVGSSKVQKTDVRVVAATNVDLSEAVASGRFREDLYYRLNIVPIHIPPLRERQEDIPLLFKKFASDFSARYHMPAISLDAEAEKMLKQYAFPGNVRQLKNMVEQLSVIEENRVVTAQVLEKYIPNTVTSVVQVMPERAGKKMDMTFEHELIFKFLADMQRDINDLKSQIAKMRSEDMPLRVSSIAETKNLLINRGNNVDIVEKGDYDEVELSDYEEGVAKEESVSNPLSLQEQEKEMIIKALKKNNGKRKDTAKDLGISERTLYRKLIEYDLNK